VRIEPLPERLYDAAVRLWQDSGLTRPWNDPEADLRRAVSGGSSCVLAAIGDDDGLLATGMVGHDGHRGWVYYLAVDIAQRNRGLGKQMMEACEDWVRSRGIPKIQLMVRGTNRVTVGFYEHLGYADSEVVVLGRRLDDLSQIALHRSGRRASREIRLSAPILVRGGAITAAQNWTSGAAACAIRSFRARTSVLLAAGRTISSHVTVIW
jgi:GNAT superfamily N-acetyltransferase